MGAGLTIQDGLGTNNLLAISAAGAGRALLYDTAGNPLVFQDRGAFAPGVGSGLLNFGVDYNTARAIRSSPSGSLRVNDETPYLIDDVEGAAVSTSKWIQTTTTMTIAQASGVITLNSGNSVAATVGAMHTSNRRFPLINRASLVFRARFKPNAHFNGNLHELGFGAPATATTVSAGDGAFWRKDGTGQWVPVLSINGNEFFGLPISNATFVAAVATTDSCNCEVFLEETRAKFTLTKSDGSTIVSEQWVEMPPTTAAFTLTHVQAFYRTYNASAPATAVQLQVASTTVLGVDGVASNREWETALAAMGQSGDVSPTAYTQLANYANSAAPASATLSNTAAGYNTLGGQWQFAAVAGAETDYALFGFQNPAPYTLIVKGVQISTFNMVAAVATTPTLMQWSMAFNSSAVSLATAAPYTPMRVTLGSQSLPVGLAAGGNVPDLIARFGSRYAVQPGKFLHVILKMPVATATATEVIRGTCRIDGYFE